MGEIALNARSFWKHTNKEENKLLIEGFGFSGYRSFGSELVKIAPLRKVNLIIGQNNSGKSNIINFLKYQYGHFRQMAELDKNTYRHTGYHKKVMEHDFSKTDVNLSMNEMEEKTYQISFPLPLEEVNDYIISNFRDKNPTDQALKLGHRAMEILFPRDESFVWFTYKSSSPKTLFELLNPTQKTDYLLKFISQSEWHMLQHTMIGNQGGSIENIISEIVNKLSYVPPSLSRIEIIPAIRRVGETGSVAEDYSGNGIIERLAKIQNPPLDSHQEDKKTFEKINIFVQSVLENKSASIEIPYERDTVLVHMDGKTLPLKSLGTGIHEVVILAAAATLLEETIICVEEPELHLHPLLQKKLIRYLSIKTSNQYIFTTHSAHLLDAVEAEIFHVSLENGLSKVRSAHNDKHKSDICRDLGYRASDLLQANCIIWVEGPSDRLYINYWLKEKKCNLLEGIHYSIMFYGGRLLSHLTGMEEDEFKKDEAANFISLRRLNRNSAVIFDSDKPSARAKVSATKRRIESEFNEFPSLFWMTKGRKIENYLNEDSLEATILKVHPSVKGIVQKGQWSNLLKCQKKRSTKIVTADKFKVAEHYISHYPANFNILDLNKKIEDLIEFIKHSNGIL